MAVTELVPRPPGAPDQWEPKSPLGNARAMLAWDRRSEARALLERVLEGDELDSAEHNATALLALALMDAGSGDRASALRLLNRADLALDANEINRHPVRWDVRLAVARLLADGGDAAAAARCAREAIVLFEESDWSVGCLRPMLLDLRGYAIADGAYDAAFMVPRAVGVLQLNELADAWQWVLLQRAILEKLMDKGNARAAALHLRVAMHAMPFDILGEERFWREVAQMMGRIQPALESDQSHILFDAFTILEAEYDELHRYEEEAPLLPRERVVSRWS